MFFSDDMKNNNHHTHHLRDSDDISGDDQNKKYKNDTTSTFDPTKALIKTTIAGDGATIEVSRRPRGRPPGSKNKPKPPLVITRDAEPPAAMRTHILEISTGHDIVDAIAAFARRRSIGLCVLAGSGSVSNVTLRQPMQTPTAIVLRGRFEILSLSGSMLPPSLTTMQGGVSVSLAGPQGQVIGGMVAAPLLAAGTVVVVAAGFENPSFNRLPEDNDDATAVNVSPTGDDGCEADAQAHHQQQQHHHHHHHRHEHELNAPPAESCGMAMYNSDAIWAPTPRPPPPPPPPSSRY